ncbi:type II toxin-antitoxin system ParD family antitoxin [Mycobacterium lepromatosis]
MRIPEDRETQLRALCETPSADEHNGTSTSFNFGAFLGHRQDD